MNRKGGGDNPAGYPPKLAHTQATCGRPRCNRRANYRRENCVKRNWWCGRQLWQATGKGSKLPVCNWETRDPRVCNIHVVLR